MTIASVEPLAGKPTVTLAQAGKKPEDGAITDSAAAATTSRSARLQRHGGATITVTGRDMAGEQTGPR